jgi:ubiquinone/menaquinone biosynthesis C-methylase UbiE
MELYSQEHIKNWYNEYGEQETLRWERSIIEEVKYEIHLQILNDNIQKEDKVLELGAGTGMFTKEIAKITSDLIVSDLSSVQLDLNKKRASDLDYFEKVKSWDIIDITNLSSFKDNSFDKIVCFGGPLSYVFEKKHDALKEFKRVLKPNGMALISVMNLWGTINEHLLPIITGVPKEENEKIIKTGNLHPSSYAPTEHHCHMFRLDEFKSDIEKAKFQIIDISASNSLSALRVSDLEELKKDDEKWNYFLSLEKRACKSLGMIESGSHIIIAIKNI